MDTARWWCSAGLFALLAPGCETVLGLDWTPADRAAGGAGGGGTTSDAGVSTHDAGGGGATSAGGGDGFTSGDAGACIVERCPVPTNACLLPGCAGGRCVVVLAPAGAPCPQPGGTVCDGSGSCVGCNDGSDCTGLAATCKRQVCSSCDDGITSADETDVDCGGPDCDPCGKGKHCTVESDCKANLDCVAGSCQKS